VTEGKGLPTALRSEPIVDVVCEVRFETDSTDAVSLLPGILAESFGDFDRIERSPVSDIPSEFHLRDEFRFQPHVKLAKANRWISIGPGMISASTLPPYGGWQDFSAYAFAVISVLKGRKFAKSFSRISLRYTDVIAHDHPPHIGWLNADLRIGNQRSFDSFQVRTQREDAGVTIINQIAGPAKTIDGRTGLIVDVDTIGSAPDDFWDKFDEAFNSLHAVNKRAFFDLLTSETLGRLGPEY